MTYQNPDPIPGDYFFLFTNLTINPELYCQLPIEIYPGIHLASTPYHAVAQGAPSGSSQEKHSGLGAWVYPGHGIGMGQCHACIKVDSSIPSNLRERYSWIMVGALYLVKPLHMSIGGSFEYGTPQDGLLKMPGHINHRSNIKLNSFFSHVNDANANQPEGKETYLLQYEREDLERAGKYFFTIIKIFDLRHKMPRPYFAIKAFF